MFSLLSNTILSGMILLSLTGLKVNLHYCQGGLYDLALNAPAKDCCDDETHHHHCPADHDMDKSNQCEDETVKFESTDNFLVSSYSFDFSDLQGMDLLIKTAIFPKNKGTVDEACKRVLQYRKPPTLFEVELSQVQSFRI